MIVVTGANGLLGSAIVKRFHREKLPVRALVRQQSRLDLLGQIADIREGDILDMPSLLTNLEGADTVIHCAGMVSFNPRHQEKIFTTNTEGTSNVVNACLKQHVRKLIHVSSVAALGRKKGSTLVDENSQWNLHAESDYATSKYLAELEAFRGMEEGLSLSIINPSVVLAPGDGQRSTSQIFDYIWNERKFYIDSLLNFVDVRDVAEMILKLYQQNHNGQRFIASAGSVELKKVFEGIASRFKKQPPSIRVPSWLAGTAAQIEFWRSHLGGHEPLITRHAARALREKITFVNTKSLNQLQMQFQTLDTTLDWCCSEFINNNINK